MKGCREILEKMRESGDLLPIGMHACRKTIDIFIEALRENLLQISAQLPRRNDDFYFQKKIRID